MYSKLTLILFLLLQSTLFAQNIHYSTANAHSHNNYEQPVIFWEAYNQQFGSIEADIFLLPDSGNLRVAHSARDLAIASNCLASL